MPYSYHKKSDQYIVTKKDTGKEVGRTKGTKEALNKYLAALHINANENKTMKKSELTKMIQEVIKEVLSERSTNKVNEAGDMFVSGGNINPELRKKVEQFVKGIAKYYDYSVDDAFLAIMTILKGGISKEGINETHTTIKIGDIVSKKYASTDEDYTKEFKVIDITGMKATLQDTSTGKKTGIALSDLTKIPMKEATTDYMKRRQAQDDYATNKKDAPKKQSKMSASTGKTDYMKRREAEKKMNETNMFVTEGKSEVILSNQILDFLQERDLITSINAQKVHKELTAFIKNKIESDNNANEIEEAAPAKDKDGSAAFDTAVAFRLVAKGNRDEAFAELQKDINKNKNAANGKFSKVKETFILSKGNPQDIILKLNGPSARSMGINTITAKDKTKEYINPVIRNNFSKVSPYTPQLTKI
jgi:hypothetical protein